MPVDEAGDWVYGSYPEYLDSNGNWVVYASGSLGRDEAGSWVFGLSGPSTISVSGTFGVQASGTASSGGGGSSQFVLID